VSEDIPIRPGGRMMQMIAHQNPRPARTAAAVVTGMLLAAAVLPAQTNVVMLWPNGAPGSESWTQKEAEYAVGNSGLKAVRNVVKPSITVYLPSAETATGTSVVVAPGGAFRMLSWDSEGTQVADWSSPNPRPAPRPAEVERPEQEGQAAEPP